MNVIRAGTLGWVHWTYCTYMHPVSTPPNLKTPEKKIIMFINLGRTYHWCGNNLLDETNLDLHFNPLCIHAIKTFVLVQTLIFLIIKTYVHKLFQKLLCSRVLSCCIQRARLIISNYYVIGCRLGSKSSGPEDIFFPLPGRHHARLLLDTTHILGLARKQLN